MSTCTDLRPAAAPAPARRDGRTWGAAERHPRARRATRASACRTAPRRTPAPVPAALRLTRRGRLVLLALLLLVVGGAVVGGVAGASRAGSTASPAAVTATTVAPGETLWQIAQRTAPQQDPRDVVAEIRALNGLASGELRAGQQLLLPA